MSIPTPKQYLMVLDDVTMALLGRLCPTLRFLEVEGMPMKECDTHTLLVNPKHLPQETTHIPEAVVEETPIQ